MNVILIEVCALGTISASISTTTRVPAAPLESVSGPRLFIGTIEDIEIYQHHLHYVMQYGYGGANEVNTIHRSRPQQEKCERLTTILKTVHCQNAHSRHSTISHNSVAS
jgi:hypothetical protein